MLKSLSMAAQNELANLVTLLLGITIGSTMTADRFLQLATLLIIGLGLVRLHLRHRRRRAVRQALNLFLKKKINPMIGAAGISAFPMSARVIHTMGLKEDPSTFLLMYAVSANVSGQIGSVLAGGLILALVPLLVK